MNDNLIRRVIADQKEELLFRQNLNYVKRDKYNFAKEFLEEKIVSQGIYAMIILMLFLSISRHLNRYKVYYSKTLKKY
jgi:hypothetical protein